MMSEALKIYTLPSAEADYEEPGQHEPMELMESGGEFHSRNSAHWAYQKQPSFQRSS